MVGIFRLHHRVSLRFFLSSQSINNNVDIYSLWCGGDLAERGTLAGAKKFMKYALERTLSSAFFLLLCHALRCESGMLFADGAKTMIWRLFGDVI